MRLKVIPAAHLLRAMLVLAASAVTAGVLAGLLSRGVMRVASLIELLRGPAVHLGWLTQADPGCGPFVFRAGHLIVRLGTTRIAGFLATQGVLFGGLLFLVFLGAQLRPEMLLVKFLFALVSIVYGVTLAFLVAELEARARRWIRLS